MKKKDLSYYDAFQHYDALEFTSNCDLPTVKMLYRLMEETGVVELPDTFLKRREKGNFAFKCDFFISKVPGTKTIKWIPTRSKDKQAKFVYRPATYFVDKLKELDPSSLSSVRPPSVEEETRLDKQIQEITNSKFIEHLITKKIDYTPF